MWKSTKVMYLKSNIKAQPTIIGTTKLNIYKCMQYNHTPECQINSRFITLMKKIINELKHKH